MLRNIIAGCVSLSCLWSAPAPAGLPTWWRDFSALPRLESRFVQESESAVFGGLQRQGNLQLAKGGRLRVEYGTGMLLVADGHTLVQYDPGARTAQRLELASAAADTPLLNVLINPGSLSGFYQAKPGAEPDSVALEPLRPSLPAVQLAGQGRMLKRIQWTDATGAKQTLTFQDPHVPAVFGAGTFVFRAPAGTRWLGAR